MNWYEENVEEPVRQLVTILRNHGFNTFSSCGHEMVVQLELYYDTDYLLRLYNLLQTHGYHNFMITSTIQSLGALGTYNHITIELLKNKDNEYDHGVEALERENP